MSSSDASSHTVQEQSANVATRPKKMRRSMDSSDDNSAIRRRNVKVPPFSAEDPEIWFAVLESQFDNYGITADQVKYNHVIANLDVPNAKNVKDIIINPPAQNRYLKIKAELIRRLSDSHELKTKQLLTHEVLGDRRPSQFLRHLQDLAGPSVPEDFLRSIWHSRLPSNIQTVLASQDTGLEKQAELADRVYEITTPSVSSTSQPSSEIAELKAMVASLALKLDEHTRGASCCETSRSRPQHRRPSTSTQRPRSRSASSYKKYPVCWYHAKFGTSATRCQQPCDFGKSGNGQGSR